MTALLLLVACLPAKTRPSGPDTDPGVDTAAPDTGTDTAAPDTGAPDTDTGAPDTGADTGEPPPPSAPLDACAAAGVPLTTRWTRQDGAAPLSGLDWSGGVLVAIDAGHQLRTWAAPADGSAPTPTGLLSLEIGLFDAIVRDGDAWAVAHDGLVRHTPGSTEIDYLPGLASITGLHTLSAGDPGLLVAATDTLAWVAPGGATTALAPDLAPAVAAARGDAAWVAAFDGTRPWVQRLGTTTRGPLVAIDGVMGPPSAIAPLPAGGVQVAGGPDTYGWVATFDDTGALVSSMQFFVGVHSLRASPGSAFTWGAFTGMGITAFAADGMFTAVLTDHPDLSDLVVDPDGRWVISAHADGALRGHGCVLEDAG